MSLVQLHARPATYERPDADAWNPDTYAKNASFVFENANSLVNILNPQPGERVLDIGCGSGELTLELLKSGCEVVGIDSSPSMVERAKEKGVDARLIDAHELQFEEEFDAAFANCSLHWMADNPRGVVQNVHRSLRPLGRFVLEFCGYGSVQGIVKAISNAFDARQMDMPKYWYFPSKEEYVQLLESEGMEVKRAVFYPKRIAHTFGITEWLDTFGGIYTSHFDEAERAQVKEEIAASFEPSSVDEDGNVNLEYIRLRIHAVKKTA